VSLNNRIYFRDHPSPVAVVDSGLVVGSEQSRRSAVASFRFPQGSPLPPLTNTIDGGFKLHSVSHTMDLESGKGDAVSISSGPR
jgi:hypothetical protein